MRLLHSFAVLLSSTSTVLAQLTSSNLEKHVGSATLSHPFNPVEEAYWTGYPHHRRTPFAVSPDGSTAYVAYLDASETDVHVQAIDPQTFTATGTAVTVTGAKEAGGLVAHDDGFALLTNEALPSGTADAPGETPVAVLYRYTDGEQSWKTFLGGPGVDANFGLVSSPDLNGDLVFSEAAGYYAAYFVVTAYTGSASGHFGDAIRYITPSGDLEMISGASSSWGCSHNTGIAFEAADAPPFASLCAEDQGAIWLNTETQGMGNNGVKVSNEVVINGGSNEPMGGMGGSYSSLARFIGEDSYVFSWVSRGSMDLTENEWMGPGYTKSQNRTSNRNVAIALFSDKATIVGEQAPSAIGTEDGDSQINWVTDGSADCSNAHAAAFDGSRALVSWEEIASPICDFVAMGCRGDFSGTYYQLVDGTGAKIGEPVQSLDSYVAGDMVTMGDGRVCWPYVDMEWRLDAVVRSLPSSETTELSFACISLDGAGGGNGDTTSSIVDTPSSTAQASSAAPISTTAPAPSPSPTEAESVPTIPAVPTQSAVSEPISTGEPEEESQAVTEESPATSTVVDTPAPTPDETEAPAPSLTPVPEVSSKKCAPKTVWTTLTVYG